MTSYDDAAPTVAFARRPDPDDRAAPPPVRRRRRRRPFWVEVPVLIAIAVVLAVGVQGFVVQMYVIPSGSMEPTLHGCPGCTNDRVAVDKLSYRFTEPARGDVVVFRGPPAWARNGEVSGDRPVGGAAGFLLDLGAWSSLSTPGEKDFVKRVVAVGGQTVACCDAADHVTVDGRGVPEPFVAEDPGAAARQAPFPPVTLAPGQLWVMGDNRNHSSDSRAHGPITLTDVIGEARLVVLPVDRLQRVGG